MCYDQAMSEYLLYRFLLPEVALHNYVLDHGNEYDAYYSSQVAWEGVQLGNPVLSIAQSH